MKLIRSFIHAWNGFRICFRSEINFRIHLLLSVLAGAMGFLFHISAVEWMVILVCMALVVSMELINTAFEKLCDVTDLTVRPEIKAIKDMAAAAVLISAIVSLVTGFIIFIPKIIDQFFVS